MRHADRIRLTLAVAGKDWRLFWADRRAALLCFVVPVLLASAFGALFDRPATDAVALPLLVVAETPGVQRFAEAIANTPRVEARIVSRADAERLVADRQPGVAVFVPADAESLTRWLPGESRPKPRLTILYHPLCRAEAQWAEGAATEAVMKAVASATVGPVALPFDTVSQPVGGGSRFDSYAHSFSGMTIQYLLFWGMESGLLLLRERSRGVWQRVRAAPVPLGCVLAGRAVATAGVALLQVAVTFAVGRVVFGVGVGSPVGFLLIAAATGLLAAATGLLVATVGGTEARARSVCVLVILGVSMVGGLWLPAFLLPGWARDLARWVPTAWAMRGFDAVTWDGRGFAGAVGPAALVTAFAGLMLWVAGRRFRCLRSSP